MSAVRDFAFLNARVRAARSRIISEQVFLRLAALPDTGTVLILLADTPYAPELSKLAGDDPPSKMDIAIQAHLRRTFRDLRRWAAGKAALLLRRILVRGDIEDLKAVLRGAWGEEPGAEVRRALTGFGNLPQKAWDEMLANPGIDGCLAVLDRWLQPWAAELRKTAWLPGSRLADIEDTLDRLYYRGLLELSGVAPWDSHKVLSGFARRLLALSDQRTHIRLRGGPPNEGGTESRSDFESRLDREELRLARSLYLGSPLTIGPTAGWIWEKLWEARLVRLILRGKREGLLPEVLAAEVTGG